MRSGADGMEALRASVGHLRAGDPAADRLRLTGAIMVFAAAWARSQAGQPPIAPKAGLSHAADGLRMLSGADPEPARVAGLDAYLCCVVDHGMNASTFAARVVSSTGSDLVSAIVAAIGALKGPLHGGAPGPVLDMLDAIGDPGHARQWLETELPPDAASWAWAIGSPCARSPRGRTRTRRVGFRAVGREGGSLAHRAGRRTRGRADFAERHPDRPLKPTSSSTRLCCSTRSACLARSSLHVRGVARRRLVRARGRTPSRRPSHPARLEIHRAATAGMTRLRVAAAS
jgi:citrate synthase